MTAYELIVAMFVVGIVRGGLEIRYNQDNTQDNTHHTRLLTSYDLGVQQIELPGVLLVDGVPTVLTVLTFLKASRATNGSLV